MDIKYVISLSILIVLITGSLFLLNDRKDLKTPDNKLRIVTSFYPLYFFASEITKDKALILNITPSGAEPHEYEPTARDLANIENSDVLILNGGGLESWSKNITKNLKKDKTTIINVADDLILKSLIKKEGTVVDPHIWLSPIIAKEMVNEIENELSKIDPDNSVYYRSNSQNLKIRLDKLDEEFRHNLSTCKNKNIITSHSAFAYLAREYNLNQVSIVGLSSEEEPSSKQMTEISKFARNNDIKYIFFESLISPKLSETIAREIGARTLVLNPLEGLTENEIINGKDYFSEMRNNLTNLKIALQCI